MVYIMNDKHVPPPAPEKCWKCSGCGYILRGDVGTCVGRCYDPTGKFCDAVPCPKCARVHYWSGSFTPPAPIPAEQEKEGWRCEGCDGLFTDEDLAYYTSDDVTLCDDCFSEVPKSASPAPAVQRENSVGGTISVPCVFPASGIVVATEDNSKTVGATLPEANSGLPGAVGASVAPAPQRCDEQRPQRGTEEIARAFHEAYERLAPSFGYKTREASAKPWSEVPEQNRNLMIAVVESLDLAPAAQLATMREQRDDNYEGLKKKDATIAALRDEIRLLRERRHLWQDQSTELSTATSRLRQCEEGVKKIVKDVVEASDPDDTELPFHRGWDMGWDSAAGEISKQLEILFAALAAPPEVGK